MNIGLVSNSYGSITNGNGALMSAKTNAENSKFMDLLKSMQNKDENSDVNGTSGSLGGNGVRNASGVGSSNGMGSVSSAQILQNGRLNGEYTSGFGGTYTSQKDKESAPVGAAANQANSHVQRKNIDRTSELYEKSMELENYFVKQMLSEMRKTVMKSKDSDFAQQTYEDMLFDEYSTMMTKNAGFGLADQIYLSLV